MYCLLSVREVKLKSEILLKEEVGSVEVQASSTEVF